MIDSVHFITVGLVRLRLSSVVLILILLADWIDFVWLDLWVGRLIGVVEVVILRRGERGAGGGCRQARAGGCARQAALYFAPRTAGMFQYRVVALGLCHWLEIKSNLFTWEYSVITGPSTVSFIQCYSTK